MTAATHSEFSIKSNFCLKDIPTSPGLCFDEEKVHNSPYDPLRRFFAWWRRLRMGTGWWRKRALQETVVWSPTPFNPSKLSLRRVNPLKGLGHRDEPFQMERRVSRIEQSRAVALHRLCWSKAWWETTDWRHSLMLIGSDNRDAAFSYNFFFFFNLI